MLSQSVLGAVPRVSVNISCFPMMQDPLEEISMPGSREGTISSFIKSEQLVLGNTEFLLKMDDAIELPLINELFFVDCSCHCV